MPGSSTAIRMPLSLFQPDGDICAAGNTAYLIMAERSLMRPAEILKDKAIAARCKARVEKAVGAMRQLMWDEEAGTFLPVKPESLEKIPVGTIGSWMALMAGVPTKTMARRMTEALQTGHWTSPLPVPTVDRKDRRWKADAYWRGDVWPAPNYQIATGLARYGCKDQAAGIADKTIPNARKNGVNEHYDKASPAEVQIPGAPSLFWVQAQYTPASFASRLPSSVFRGSS
jgi:glycogen debranching enzyme